jgi:predicted nucleic acid-binding protein
MRSKSESQRFFLDTNIFVYCFDSTASRKKAKSNELVARALSSGAGIISHQVIQEFVSVALTKFRKVFDPARLVVYLDEVLFTLWKAYPSRETYISAVEIQKQHHLSWWDALIVAAALDTGCHLLFSEDLQHGLRIGTLLIQNPFGEGGE